MRPRRLRGKIRFKIIAAVVLVVAFQAVVAWARAGGGGGFHGGGSSGGGGGHGGGGGGGVDISGLIWLLFRYPAIGVPVLIIVVVFVIYSQQQGTSAYQSGVLRRGGPIIDDNRKQAILAQLRQHDPAFDEAAFNQRVASAFSQIQTAWCGQNLKSVQLFLSDGVAERFALQFAEQQSMGYHDQMSQIAIDDVRISDLDTTGVFDEISVRIVARASDFRSPTNSTKPGQGPPAPVQTLPDLTVQPFTEIWSFLRRRGAVTDTSKPGLIEGHCPNCGAAIEMNQNAQCPYCHAQLHSGQYDWVLSEITQESEWERSSDRPIPGLAVIQQKDASFDRQALEDRASVIFWRRASADRLGKLDPIRKVATDAFCESIRPQVTGNAGQPRTYAGECAVGGVELVALIPATSGSTDGVPMDRAIVRVRWSGKIFTLDPTRQHIAVGNDILRTTALTLARKPVARTDPDKSISSAHCPNCGAPESDSASNACPNCGTVLNDGSRDWVLIGWDPIDSPSVNALLSAAAANDPSPPAVSVDARAGVSAGKLPTSSAALVQWAIKMAAADGTIDAGEREQLNSLAEHAAITPDQMSTWIAAASRDDFHIPEPSGPEEAREWVAALAKIALSDGILDRRESALLQSIGTRANLSAYDINILLKRTQASEYAAARDAKNRR